MESSKLRFVLASSSPRRKELIGHLGIPFEIRTLDVAEESAASDPVRFSGEIAEKKGRAVYEKLREEAPESPLFVVSADTIVCLEKKIYGKPRDRDEARVFLTELSGKTHSVFTAVCVKVFSRNAEDGFSFVEESRVSFDRISPELMETYLDTRDSLDKAGAYGIQGPSLTFISRVDGSYSNVVGFPLSAFVQRTEKFLTAKFPKEASWFNCFAR